MMGSGWAAGGGWSRSTGEKLGAGCWRPLSAPTSSRQSSSSSQPLAAATCSAVMPVASVGGRLPPPPLPLSEAAASAAPHRRVAARSGQVECWACRQNGKTGQCVATCDVNPAKTSPGLAAAACRQQHSSAHSRLRHRRKLCKVGPALTVGMRPLTAGQSRETS